MDAARRQRYLDAMGIPNWRPRDPAAAGSAAAVERSAGGSTEAVAALAWPVDLATPVAGLSTDRDAAPSPAPPPAGRPEVGAMDWETLHATVTRCTACPLAQTRTRTVFGVGDRAARLMVIGEAPGADEDLQGEPFVGRAGQLLNLMLAAIALPREAVYIANVLKCRPPGNRDPRAEEAHHCEPFLLRQIALIRPRVLLALGRIAAQHLLRTEAPIGSLRGRWHSLGPDQPPLMVTYHPAFLLRSPEQKAKAWQDLIEVARRLRAPDA